ncbi:MAG TPA: hypothetical protein VNK49_09390, partial [Anaerolineales bacterium]|nr:hypothetical protein [Anaerolineales bacterium]
MSAGLEVGIGLIVLAFALLVPVLAVVGLRRLAFNAGSFSQPPSPAFPSSTDAQPNEGVLLVQAGGRV